MQIGKVTITPLEGAMNLEDENTWFEIDDEGCLKIKASKQIGNAIEETSIALSKKLTDKLAKFLECLNRK